MTRARPWLLPLALLVLALALRATGIGFFLPHQSDPDDHAIDQLHRMRTGESQLVGTWGKYGHLVARTLWLLPTPHTDAPLDAAHVDEHLAVASADHLRARWISALLGALSVPLCYFLARTWLAPGPSCVAALALATSLLHLSFSQQARPHVPFTTLALLTVLAALRVRAEPRPARALQFALALFLACGTLHSAVFLLPCGLLALLLRRPDRAALGWPWVACALLGVAAAAVVFWPFLLEAGATIQTSAAESSERFPHLVDASMFDGRGFLVWYEALAGYDPLLLAGAALGTLIALARALTRRHELDAEGWRALAVALSFALPCALVFGVFGRSFERFFLPLYPFLCVAFALAVRDVAALASALARKLAGHALPRASLCAWAALALALPAFAAAKLVWLRAQPDTLELAARALDELEPTRARALLLHPRAFLPLPIDAVDADHEWYQSVWMRYAQDPALRRGEPAGRRVAVIPKYLARRITQKPLPGNVAALTAGLPVLGADYVLDILADEGAEPSSLSAALERAGELVWSTEAGPGVRFARNGYQEPDMLAIVLHARVWGPRLALWRLRAPRR